jgi:soluble lytic murein transglycosylase
MVFVGAAKRLFLLSFFLGSTLFASAGWAVRRPASVRPDPDLIRKAQGMADLGKFDDAMKLLRKAADKETDVSKRALIHFALAVILEKGSRPIDADTELTSAINEGGLRVADYAYYERGMLRKKAGKLSDARADFQKVLDLKPSPSTETDARYELGLLLMADRNWKAADKEFKALKKKTRGTDRYADALYNLMRAERHDGARDGSCALARELFAKYPSYALISDWGPVLEKNKVDGDALGCHAKPNDLKTRIRRLQLTGFSDRAVKELESVKSETGDDQQMQVDTMLANHFISEGEVDDALKLIMKHYASEKDKPAYLNLLAKAFSRAGDYQGAIGAYQKAYEVAPHAHDAVTPLFQAAFTSYQIQDYDGATRRFEDLTHQFPNSKLARDAKWHLAWMRYLRGDYAGALDRFTDLSKVPARRVTRHRHGHRNHNRPGEAGDALASDRLKYWSAMSLLKLGRIQEAIPILQNLVRDPAIGYYSILSFYRLLAVPNAKLPPGVEVRLGLKKTDSSGAPIAPSETELQAAAAVAAEVEADEPPPSATETEEAAATETDGGATAADVSTDPAGDSGVERADEPFKDDADFKDASFAVKFERARDLALIGLFSGARRELGEIEKRARKSEDRKLLMAEYAQVENYYRSSTIGELGFGPQRMRGGLRGDSRMLWEFAYPRAWEPAVLQSSRATSVPEEFIWGIMRAESHYRSDAQSGVGALGLMQMMPFTGRQVANLLSLNSFDTSSLLDPEVNIRLGTRYLQRLLEKFSGSIPLAAAGYNAGPHRVHAWVRNFGSLDMDEFIEHIPYLETRNYVKKVVRNYQLYSLLYSGGAHSLRWLVQPVGLELDERVPTKEVW